MSSPSTSIPELRDWAADPHPLLECLGAGAVPLVPGPGVPSEQVQCAASLERFLFRYGAELMIPSELPRITEVARWSGRSMFREIIAEDSPGKTREWDPSFLSASRRIGRAQLRRMRPLRDLKGLGRYRAAVESGEALGTHTAVYGIMLGIYSIPLRQGLVHYARQTLHSLADSGSDRLGLHIEQRRVLHSRLDVELWGQVHAGINLLLPASVGVV